MDRFAGVHVPAHVPELCGAWFPVPYRLWQSSRRERLWYEGVIFHNHGRVLAALGLKGREGMVARRGGKMWGHLCVATIWFALLFGICFFFPPTSKR